MVPHLSDEETEAQLGKGHIQGHVVISWPGWDWNLGLSGLKCPSWLPGSLLCGAGALQAPGAGDWPGEEQGEEEKSRGLWSPRDPLAHLPGVWLPPGPGAGGLRTPRPSLNGGPSWGSGWELRCAKLPRGPPALPAAGPGPHNSPGAWHLRECQGSGRLMGSDKAISILE